MRSSQQVKLSPQVLERLKPAKIIKEHTKDIVGMDFSDNGQILYVADSQTLNVFLTINAQIYRKLFMKIHEIEQISHTHHNSAILVATKKEHLILYWSIHENRVIKMFKGHTDTITNLMLNPKNDYFLTTSNDNTMRIWNLNSKNQDCQFKLSVEAQNISAYPVAAFDPSGLVFAVAWSEQQKDKQIVRICLYGMENCETGPFTDWRKDYNEIKVMKFSPNGQYLILATSDNSIILLDAYEGGQVFKFTNFVNQSSIIECSFTPDSQYIISGSQNGQVHVWNIKGNDIAKLSSHVEKVSFVKFSPTNCLLASGGRNLTLWLPEMNN